MAHETAARWCWKKDWGDARPRPYWVESCPCGPAADLSSTWRRRITPGARAPVFSEQSKCTMLPFLNASSSLVPRLGVDAAHARATVQRRVGRGAQPRLAKHQSLQVLQCAAERKRVTVSRGRRAAAARRAVAQGPFAF